MGTPSRLDFILGRYAVPVDEITQEEWVEILTRVLKIVRPWLKYISDYAEAREILRDAMSDGYTSATYKAPVGRINPVELCLPLAEFASRGSNIDYSILIKKRGHELVLLSRHWKVGPDEVSKMYVEAEFDAFDIKPLVYFLIPEHSHAFQRILKRLREVLESSGEDRIVLGKRMQLIAGKILNISSKLQSQE